MATTPTLTVAASTESIIASIVTASATDTIQLWKIAPGGSPVEICTNVTMTGPVHGIYNGVFGDFAVGSGVSYSYYVVAVDGSGGTAASTTEQTSMTLTQGFLHAVTKSSGTGNSTDTGGTSVFDLRPHNRSYGLATSLYLTAGADIPTVGISAIEQIGVDIVIRIPLSTDSVRLAARAIITSRAYACYRDTRGNRFFGRLSYDEQYSSTFTDLALRFQVLDFTESVA